MGAHNKAFAIWMTILLWVFGGGAAWAQSWVIADLDDIESGMEEVINQSEASQQAAKDAERRAAQAKADRDKAKAEAQRVAVEAHEMERKAQQQIASYEKEIASYKKEMAQLDQERKITEEKLTKMTKKVEEQKVVADRTLRDLEGARSVTQEVKGRLANKLGELEKIQRDMVQINDQKQMAIQDLEKARQEEKAADIKLKEAKIKHSEATADMQKSVESYRQRAKKAREAAAVSEGEMRKLRASVEKLTEEVQIAESETEAAEGRQRESEERLREVKADTHARVQEMQQRHRATQTRSHAIEKQEAVTRMDLAQANSSYLDATTKADQSQMNVSLKSKRSAPVQRVLASTCSVYAKPSKKSKALGVWKKGQRAALVPHGKGWYRAGLAKGQVGYIPGECVK